MHAIKSSARREAWYNTPTSNFNPFGRRARRLFADEEPSQPPSRPQTLHGTTIPVDSSRVDVDCLTEATSAAILNDAAQLDSLPETTSAQSHTQTLKQEPSDQAYASRPASSGQVDFSAPCSYSLPPPNNDTESAHSKIRKHRIENVTPTKFSCNMPVMLQLRTLCYNWVSLLLAFVPAGFAVNYTHQSAVTIFIINFIATIPTSYILSAAIDEFALYFGETIANLLSMTFGNAAQVISAALLLKTRQVDVLQASLLGVILQNLLLMTGISFLVGGCRYQSQYFNINLARTIAMFLLLAVLSLVMPTAASLLGHSSASGILALSRGTAVVIILSYILYLIFQLGTNRGDYDKLVGARPGMVSSTGKEPVERDDDKAEKVFESLAKIGVASAGIGVASAGGGIKADVVILVDPEEPDLSKTVALSAAAVCTALLAFNTQFATDNLQALITQHDISKTFMGTVVLPLLGNDPNAIKMAYNDKMDVSIALTLERCMQTALMVVPLVIFNAWGMGVDTMTMEFSSFSVVGLFAAVLMVTYVIQEGRSNWLIGALLIKAFVILGLAAFVAH